MALGDPRNNNQRRFETTYYSGTRIRNYSDHTALNFSFSSGLLRISIATENDQHRYDDKITANITPNKAQILLAAIKQMLEENDEMKAYGTTLGISEIQTAIAVQSKDGNRYLRIAKVASDGTVTDQATFTFPVNTNSYLTWSDFDGMQFGKTNVEDLEFNSFCKILADFADGMSGALGYGTLYMNRYQESSLTNKVNAALEKLGVPVGTTNNIQRRSNNGGYFNNNADAPRGTSNHVNYSDIDNMLGDDEDDE